jgi:hypothetical protein
MAASVNLFAVFLMLFNFLTIYNNANEHRSAFQKTDSKIPRKINRMTLFRDNY